MQSNVTTRIRQLEEKLGVTLFIREGKRMHLSPAGQVLLDYADGCWRWPMRRRMRCRIHARAGSSAWARWRAPRRCACRVPLTEYHERYPEVTLELRTGNPQQLATAILVGKIDAALVADPVAEAPFEKAPAFTEDLVIVAAAGHPPIGPQDATPETMIAFEVGCPHRKRLESWYERRGAMPAAYRRDELLPRHTGLRGGGYGDLAHAIERARHLPRSQAPQRA